MSTPIIFDTDPGVDDAQAIAIALRHPDIELLGMTTTFGNVDIETATHNALLLGEIAGQPVPVAQGSACPMVKPRHPAPKHIHGDNGLGNITLPEVKGQADARSAAQFIVDTVRQRPGEVSLVAVGPLGNLAAALQLDPEITRLVKQVVIMGGSIREGGNVTPVAEANIFNDAHAAQRVLTADWPLTLVGLDVTHRCILTPEHMARIEAGQGELGKILAGSYDFYRAFYREALGIDGCCPHDSVALAWLLRPDLFETTRGHLGVVTEGPAEGQTILAPEGRGFIADRWSQTPVVNVCMGVDGKAVSDWIADTLA
ncbi:MULTISPECIES: nucleoside hydrolase [Halomonas]|uniref:Nucleoside hydrolase n=1 Tax=Halomonas litopenaei TaxID=2109328 RepID=A0ABX5ISV5_9GAMM|nr:MULTISPECIES: nucleoside hydrolase [Halomonas]MCO7215989.1 nucleoside hydrolase [Halomonas sp. OfavH-34-E]KJZ05323.1 nucleoside hydrolase [Halomonas sp. S2151]MBY6111886.1 nucleoside hydrolase [Halomonas sp. DP1Y21-3]PTL89573.1 nucleoside hydrolase [Halomonas sp. SYSU XM8]PTL91627.1 nucleoside hydrolase [Halomonas litopenaei]